MTSNLAILWFRQDLRIQDNPALNYALKNKYKILPVYIRDDKNADVWKNGEASNWWLRHSLNALNQSLFGSLQIFSGDAWHIMTQLIQMHMPNAVFWNRCYEPWCMARDSEIKDKLIERNLEVMTFNASLLWEPWSVKKSDGTPYKVFTPFYKKGCMSQPEPKMPHTEPVHRDAFLKPELNTQNQIEDIFPLPAIKWYTRIETFWSPGETGAIKRLDDFLDGNLKGYKRFRDTPDENRTSRLSPHLHFGEISPHVVWHKTRACGIRGGLEEDMHCFCSELGWREFSHSLLYYNEDLPEEPIQRKFRNFSWDKNDSALIAWQKGRTGIPIVDAGMRQLWQTGWMHNRVRMIVASLLVKNLRIHWRHGEAWFWDCLVDADLANNAASWQWVAGCGADAAPYFRIFNPVAQGEKFDPNGNYVRTYVPELHALDAKYIHKPWDAPQHVLQDAKVSLGKTYPNPICDLKETRNKALECFRQIK